jgi:hypothetical protein
MCNTVSLSNNPTDFISVARIVSLFANILYSTLFVMGDTEVTQVISLALIIISLTQALDITTNVWNSAYANSCIPVGCMITSRSRSDSNSISDAEVADKL